MGRANKLPPPGRAVLPAPVDPQYRAGVPEPAIDSQLRERYEYARQLFEWASRVGITAAHKDKGERCGNAVARVLVCAANLKGALRELCDTWNETPHGESQQEITRK